MGAPWRILVVDDEGDISENLRELVGPAAVSETGESPHVEVELSFEAALRTLEREDFDLLVLDVRNQAKAKDGQSPEEADEGLEVFERIRRRRFIPVVFYTALTYLAEELDNPPFVHVVDKLSDKRVRELRQAIRAAFASGLPRLHRALRHHVEALTREFMIEFVEGNWSDLQDHKADVAHLLMRRLGISFEGGASALASELGYPPEEESGHMVHPARFYVALPSGDYRMGDVLRGPAARLSGDESGDSTRWYVILTPSCDLVTGRVKADHVVLAECRPIETFDHYQSWIKAQRSGEGSQCDQAQEDRALVDLQAQWAAGRPLPLPACRVRYSGPHG